jgi:Zn-dependent protease/predicted RNA-binding Zn-ribbon protein involved in translation (DUF1610 family)
MLPTHRGSFRLFRFAGIQVYLHWSWFFVALIEINYRRGEYGSVVWNILEYVALFAIVLMHEFGHSLACRSVGGTANQIILWPLGGVAYVDPPPRPGATLWSIAAGPLVNLALAPMLIGAFVAAQFIGLEQSMPNLYILLRALCFIDIMLLVFNLLPIYPLDGGQILRALLWFAVGRARSLMITALIGFVGVGGLFLLAIVTRQTRLWWTGIMAAFILLNCWQGLLQARMLSRIAKLPRREGFACPTCHQPPVKGYVWRCSRCLKPYDAFESLSICPHCGFQPSETVCPDCGHSHPFNQWGSYQGVRTS